MGKWASSGCLFNFISFYWCIGRKHLEVMFDFLMIFFVVSTICNYLDRNGVTITLYKRSRDWKKKYARTYFDLPASRWSTKNWFILYCCCGCDCDWWLLLLLLQLPVVKSARVFQLMCAHTIFNRNICFSFSTKCDYPNIKKINCEPKTFTAIYILLLELQFFDVSDTIMFCLWIGRKSTLNSGNESISHRYRNEKKRNKISHLTMII